ncbi:MAG: hypothetical protein RIQ71_2005 [Verrucomicrobiota bacterium]
MPLRLRSLRRRRPFLDLGRHLCLADGVLDLRVARVKVSDQYEGYGNRGNADGQLENAVTPEGICAPAVDTMIGLGVGKTARVAIRHKSLRNKKTQSRCRDKRNPDSRLPDQRKLAISPASSGVNFELSIAFERPSALSCWPLASITAQTTAWEPAGRKS